ncbi:citrate lyase subunit alpha [Candidatus Margulisiibacteriota bacterium]
MKKIKNSLGIELPEFIEGYGKVEPFKGAWEKLSQGILEEQTVPPPNKAVQPHRDKKLASLKEAVAQSNPKNGMTVSFHHHLRGGDGVLVPVIEILAEMGIKDITLASSSLTGAHEAIVPYIEDGTITKIWSSGIRGNVGKTISKGILKKVAVIHSHGGRVRAVQTGKINIDLAVIAASAADCEGNATGSFGPSAFGSMGYAASDERYAKHVIVVTDNLVDYPCFPFFFQQRFVDAVVKVESIGDAKKIASGTTRITRTPMDLKIASLAAQVIECSGYLEPGFSFQVGAGGASLAVAKFIREIMKKKEIQGDFILGGITSYCVEMLNEGLFKTLFDVQSFDAAVSSSILNDPKHIEIPADAYANPFNKGCMTNKLDVVVLGALEIDTDFNVNVITGSLGEVRGASGGHSDTASGAKLTIAVCPSFRGRLPIIKHKVNNIVTPGESINVVVTERGICVNPLYKDLEKRLNDAGLKTIDIKDLAKEVESIVSTQRPVEYTDKIVGVIEYRDGTVIDVIRQVKNL